MENLWPADAAVQLRCLVWVMPGFLRERAFEPAWLQQWLGPWNARIKDRLERKLQVLDCEGKVSLSAARAAIRMGWEAAYASMSRVTWHWETEPDDDDGPVE